jgi:hypothetical protein
MRYDQKKKWRRAAIILCTVLMLVLVASMMAVGASAEESAPEDSVVSPALHVIAARTDMVVATLCGNEYYFSSDVFARPMNLGVGDLQYITVTALPGVTEGELMMGSVRVSEGQVISAANLRMMSYLAVDDTRESEASFRFTVNGGAYEMCCRVYLLEELNYSPTVSVATSALSVNTHRDFVGYGNLSAYDPEGDALIYEIVKAPRHGLVIMTDVSCGDYVYLPRLGYTGTDSFCYVARDVYGNYSAAAEVKVQVSAPAVSVNYADMQGRREHNAVLTMTEKGVMQGEELEGKVYFQPEMTVSRLDFLMMAMQTLGIGSVPTVGDTGFYDDADIPTEAKGYVAAAYSLGYIKGSTNAEGELCLLPNEGITRAEAAVILRRMVDAEDAQLTPAFADSSDIPAWAGEAIATLSSLGVMTPTGGAISPNEQVTRGQTAMMLAALSRVIEE